MCIAILNQSGTISLKTFKTCWHNNPDGAGFCYFDGEKIQIVKEMKNARILHDKYTEVRAKFPDIDIAIHFRIATHGRVNVTNCHPFKIDEQSAFIHNGIIQHMAPPPEFSDTHQFNELIMKGLPVDFATNNAILELLGAYIGYSKLVIISGKFSAIVNEDLGLWDQGNWFSNKTYRSEPKAPKITNKAPNVYEYEPTYLDAYEYDYKSKAWGYSARSSCDCCLQTAKKSEYITAWGLFMCPDCVKEFSEDLKEF